MRIIKAFVFLVVFLGRSSVASPEPGGLPIIATGHVVAVTDGMTLTLSTGQSVRLAGIEAPLPPLGSALGEEWPLGRFARSTLDRAAVNQDVELRGTVDTDRYGRLVAQVFRADGVWLEGAALSAGAARVQTTPRHRELAADMLRLEAQARDDRRGIWRSTLYAVHGPDGLSRASGDFKLVEGRVASVEKRRSGITASFDGGDLTLELPHSAIVLLSEGGTAADHLQGHRIRVRGWIVWRGHPMIDVTHPEQIEFLDAHDQVN